ncbi:MAG: NUDIX domain-containing protein [Bacteroidales bacterium]|nr:NUDIX domain-containing protein [Bacteroidales bacterium]
MYRIYIEKRCMIICSPTDQTLTDPNAVQFNAGDEADLHTLVDVFKTTETLQKIYIPTIDIEGTYKDICLEFKEVNAGGGLVSNRRGDYLLIRRNGLWDLPKGHQENGEDLRTTALREVKEETGISELELGKLICVTDHCYIRNDLWHLKHTWWYEITYREPRGMVPQKEEDISKAAWVAKSSLPDFLTNTYPSISEVFHEAKI